MIFICLLLIIGICICVVYLCSPSQKNSSNDSSSIISKKFIALAIALIMSFLFFGSCSSLMNDADHDRKSKQIPTTAEEAANQWQYDKDGHLRKKPEYQ